jgi:hypothetical protein
MQAFANMAWQTFKMLLWPAQLWDEHGRPVRGEADTSRDLRDRTSPRVFETYKADWETFLPDTARPLDWNSYPLIAVPCKNSPPIQIPPGALVLGSLDEFGNITVPDLPKQPGLMHALVAQNHTPVHYLAAFNENEFNLIRDRGLYNSNIVPEAGVGPPTDITNAPYGAMTIKSAWIEITPTTLNPEQFYRRPAWVQNPWSGECHRIELGLVGLHIAHKTESSPQWAWASFEHVNNAPTRGERQRRTTFNDGSGQPAPDKPPQSLLAPLPSGFIPWPVNIERLMPIAKEIATVNKNWQQALGGANGVWANYQLVLVQWPDDFYSPGNTALQAQPSPPCAFDPDTNLANSVIEAFIQPTGPTCLDQPTTCMGCHGRTRTTDLVWALSINNNRPGFAPLAELSRNRDHALTLLQGITRYNPK